MAGYRGALARLNADPAPRGLRGPPASHPQVCTHTSALWGGWLWGSAGPPLPEPSAHAHGTRSHAGWAQTCQHSRAAAVSRRPRPR